MVSFFILLVLGVRSGLFRYLFRLWTYEPQIGYFLFWENVFPAHVSLFLFCEFVVLISLSHSYLFLIPISSL